ncbi:uncharacterized protein E5676_scaffold506G00300 [Cucumis melo var. makuwa]|uniref:Retrotransposon gag domain-containing protein n=1 Tax=Cucumis melo var. makuwa TaxID=1194695 RepID=A0A5D3BDA1_CUCMM|nr:uncharacterized protein E5676_scaffold506G00300 [Cucumis melo var. makuwa]
MKMKSSLTLVEISGLTQDTGGSDPRSRWINTSENKSKAWRSLKIVLEMDCWTFKEKGENKVSKVQSKNFEMKQVKEVTPLTRSLECHLSKSRYTMPRKERGQAKSQTIIEPTIDTEAHSVNQDVRREKEEPLLERVVQTLRVEDWRILYAVRVEGVDFVTWEGFRKGFQEKFYPCLFEDVKRKEFLNTKQGDMTIAESEDNDSSTSDGKHKLIEFLKDGGGSYSCSEYVS